MVASSVRCGNRAAVGRQRDLFMSKFILSAEEKRSFQHVEERDAKSPEEDLALGVCSQLKKLVTVLVQVYFRNQVGSALKLNMALA